jgi:hypothetical protein
MRPPKWGRRSERRKVTDAGAGEDGRGDDAEQRIAALKARGKTAIPRTAHVMVRSQPS